MLGYNIGIIKHLVMFTNFSSDITNLCSEHHWNKICSEFCSSDVRLAPAKLSEFVGTSLLSVLYFEYLPV